MFYRQLKSEPVGLSHSPPWLVRSRWQTHLPGNHQAFDFADVLPHLWRRPPGVGDTWDCPSLEGAREQGRGLFIEQLRGVCLPQACAGCHLSLTPRVPQPGVAIVPILPRSESHLGHAVTGDKDAHPVSADSRAHPASLTGARAPSIVLASLPCSHLISSDTQGIELSF